MHLLDLTYNQILSERKIICKNVLMSYQKCAAQLETFIGLISFPKNIIGNNFREIEEFLVSVCFVKGHSNIHINDSK